MADPAAEPRLPPDHQLPAVPARLRPYDGPTTTADMTEECRQLAEARAAIQGPYQRRPGDVRTLLWRARALDIPVGVAIDHIFINMQGKAGLSAQLTAALLRRAGIFWTTVTTPHKVTHTFFERVPYLTRTGRPAWRRTRRGAATYTMDDARTAGVAGGQHWRRWPQACMWARAMAKGARELFPDITMGMAYTPEEIASGADEQPAAPGPGVDPDVLELVEQALSGDATPDLIRTDIMVRARKLLKRTASPEGLTLAQVLTDVWQWKTDDAAAAAADHATATAGIHPVNQPAGTAGHAETTILDEPGWADARAELGAGLLPCSCPATTLITAVHAEGVCTGAS